MAGDTLVLHAGPHKTGSTYLQYRLNKARSALAAQGWEYPNFGIVQFSQQQIYNWLNGDAKGAGEVSEKSLLALLAEHPRMIFSSEDFVYLHRPNLLRLKELIGDRKIEVILYLRTPVDLLPSHWQELVRHGRDITLLEYLAAGVGWNESLPGSTVGILNQVSKFANVFGKESVRLFCYNNLVHEKTDIFEHFWSQILRLPGPAPEEASRTINASQPADKIEMLRNLNAVFFERFGRPPDQQVLRIYQRQEGQVQTLPDYENFKKTFLQIAPKVTLNSNQEFFRFRERMLLNAFRFNIENRASDEKIYLQESFARTIPYGERYWVDRYGLRGFVDELFNRLNLG